MRSTGGHLEPAFVCPVIINPIDKKLLFVIFTNHLGYDVKGTFAGSIITETRPENN